MRLKVGLCIKHMALTLVQASESPRSRYEHKFLRFPYSQDTSYSRSCPITLVDRLLIYSNRNTHFGHFCLPVIVFPFGQHYNCCLSSIISYSLINMPKIEKAPIAHRGSISTASAAGGSTRSSSWSTQDDETLIQARTQGLNWNQIAPKHFPNKSPNACRKRHERLMERMNAEQWDGVKLDVLAQAYMEVRRDMWSLLAARVGEKWQLVETKVSLLPKMEQTLLTRSFSAWRKALRTCHRLLGQR